jgi:predicted nucleic acid-binding protein
MNCYCDSSFFLRQLLPSLIRTDAIRAAEDVAKRFAFVLISSFTRFEVIQALRFEVWRNQNDRTKGLPPAHVGSALNLFISEIGSAYRIVPIDWSLSFERAEILTRNTPQQGWRTVDILHVACAIVSGAKEFYSYDHNQNLLASGEGLKTPLLQLSA